MLLYRISPVFPMQWAGSPLSNHEIDLLVHLDELMDISWKPANYEPDETTIRLAFRYGVAQAAFLVFSGETISHHRHSVDLAQTQGKLASMLPGLSSDLTESLAFDSAKELAGLRARVADTIASKDPDPVLVLHWEDLGGFLPDPV